MSNGLRYETGRDMPPGMAEKVAVQLARQMEAATPAAAPEALPVAGCEVANKKRLIDAEPLMEDGWHLVKTGKSNVFLSSMSLADVPTVDAVEVVHGRWIKDGDVVVCSNCGEEHAWDEYRATFCEDCGAKMDGERREGE